MHYLPGTLSHLHLMSVVLDPSTLQTDLRIFGKHESSTHPGQRELNNSILDPTRKQYPLPV